MELPKDGSPVEDMEPSRQDRTCPAQGVAGGGLRGGLPRLERPQSRVAVAGDGRNRKNGRAVWTMLMPMSAALEVSQQV